MRRAPAMTRAHRIKRVQWETQNAANLHNYWRNVIWYDKKKFTLTGLDGMAY